MTQKLTESDFIGNPEDVLYNPIWEFISKNKEIGSVGDADMIVRIYDQYDDHGKMFLFECKKQGALMNSQSQVRIYYIMDLALKNLKLPTFEYKGFYLLHPIGDLAGVIVNNTHLTTDEFIDFLFGKIEIEPYDLEKTMKRHGWL